MPIKETEENLEFVARYYRDNTLLPAEGWQRFRKRHPLANLRRNIAAAAIAVALTAAAAVTTWYIVSSPAPAPEETQPTPPPTQTITPAETTRKIEFHDASLQQVVAEIERLYDVKIENLPNEEIRVTISYKGTAEDVVATLNELFDTNLKIAAK